MRCYSRRKGWSDGIEQVHQCIACGSGDRSHAAGLWPVCGGYSVRCSARTLAFRCSLTIPKGISIESVSLPQGP